MSIGAGGLGDLRIRQYHDILEQDLQQRGSKLRGVVKVEQVMGEYSYFPKVGQSSSYQVTGRGQSVNVQDQVYERRFITPTPIEATHHIYKMDVLRYARSPQPELVESLAFALGRDIDRQIITAMSGAANRELNGTLSTITLASFQGTKLDGTAMASSSQLILVNDNSFGAPAQAASTTAMSGNTSLHEGKLLNARMIMAQQGAIQPNERLVCLLNAKQAAGLSSRQWASNSAGYFKSSPDLDNPNFDTALSGYLGMDFIITEFLGKDNTGSYDAVYVIARDAIKMGIYQDLNFRVDELPQVQNTPIQLKADMSIGCVRFWDEKVVQIACNPTLTYS